MHCLPWGEKVRGAGRDACGAPGASVPAGLVSSRLIRGSWKRVLDRRLAAPSQAVSCPDFGFVLMLLWKKQRRQNMLLSCQTPSGCTKSQRSRGQSGGEVTEGEGVVVEIWMFSSCSDTLPALRDSGWPNTPINHFEARLERFNSLFFGLHWLKYPCCTCRRLTCYQRAWAIPKPSSSSFPQLFPLSIHLWLKLRSVIV